MADIVREWTYGFDALRSHQAVACLLFYLGVNKQVQRDEHALREALADLVRGLKTNVDAAANPNYRAIWGMMSHQPLEDALRELDVDRAIETWDAEFTRKGAQVCWRPEIIGGVWPDDALSSMAQLVISKEGGVPSFAWGLEPRHGSRSRWRWPLRVGVLPDDPEIRFAVEDAWRGVHDKLVRIVSLEGTNETCDLLLISIERKERFDGPVRIAATATVVVSETGWFPETPYATSRHEVSETGRFPATAYATSRHGLLGFHSHAAAAVHASAPQFVRELFDAIAHNLPLDLAICEASRECSGPVAPVIVGLPRFFERTRIVESALTLTRQSVLRGVGTDIAAGLVTELPMYRFERESLGASSIADRTVVLEQQLADYAIAPRELLADARGLPRHVDLHAVLARTPEMGLPTLPHLVRGTMNLFDFWIGRPTGEFTGIPIDDSRIDWENYEEAVDLQIELTTSDGLVLDRFLRFGSLGLNENGVVALDFPSTILPVDKAGSWLRPLQEHWERVRNGKQPLRRNLWTIRLKRGGDSDHAIITVRINDDAVAFRGRVVVLQGNRVVMTAVVEGPVIDEETAARMLSDRIATAEPTDARPPSPVTLSVEGILRNDWDELDERRRFDVAFVANHTADGTAKTTALGGGIACDIAFKGDINALKLISTHLVKLCKEPASFEGLDSHGYRKFLCELADHGVALRQAIVEETQLEDMIESKQFAERFQIVAAEPERLLPLEFIYEGKSPAHGATVCIYAQAALQAQMTSWTGGTPSTPGCPHDCPFRKGSEHVCPLRFWATTKTIEREMYDKKNVAMGTAFKVRKARAAEERDRTFPRPRYAILASSDNAWSKAPGGKETLVRQLSKTASEAGSVDSWVEWKSHVKEKKPMVLLAVAHMGNIGMNGCLFIADGSDPQLHCLLAGQVDRDVVRNHPGPVLVILMGCETAQQQNRYAGFPARFRNGEADIVMATISPILGRFGGPLAEELLFQLHRCWASGTVTTLSELVRRSRVLFAAKGNPIGFSLVAYGDADWAFR